MIYRIVFTDEAKQFLAKLRDKRELKILLSRIEELAENPDQQGKPLSKNLAGYFSIRAVSQRYRVIYRIEESAVLVIVTTLGRRKDSDSKDVYRLADKFVRTFDLQQFLDKYSEG